MAKRKLHYKKQQIPFFISKLLDILDVASSLSEEPNNNTTIAWAEKGDGFIIKNEEILSTEILPLYYNHSNLASFVRQLNIYDFRKIDSENAYMNPNFKKDEPKLLEKISRQPTKQNIQNFKKLQNPQENERLLDVKSELIKREEELSMKKDKANDTLSDLKKLKNKLTTQMENVSELN